MALNRNHPSQLTESRAARLSELDALRGLAALGVLFFHYSYNQPGINPLAQFRAGVTSVDLFFMISGYVTFLNFHDKMRPGDYLLNRFSRLFPTYWVCIVCTTTVMFLAEPEKFDLRKSLANMSMIQTFVGVEDLDGSYWTLLTELLFYSWVLVVYFIGKVKKIERAGVITLALILLYHVLRDFYPAVYNLIQRKFSITNHFPLFLSGILFLRIKKNGYTLVRIFLLLISLGAAMYLHDKGGRTMYLLSFQQHALILIAFHLIFGLMLAGKLAFLRASWLLFMGHISYSLYLMHQYIGLSIIRFLVSVNAVPVLLAILMATGCMVWVAYLVTVYVEVPVLKLLRSSFQAPLSISLRMPEVKPDVGDLAR